MHNDSHVFCFFFGALLGGRRGCVLRDASVSGEGGPLVRPNDMRALLMQNDWWVRGGCFALLG